MQTSNKELILLVDDDPGNLKRAQTILGEEFRRLHLGKWHCHFFQK